MTRLYSDENFPLRVVQALRSMGHDVLTSHESGRANRKVGDDEVLRFATEQRRAILTFNRLDFFRLHRRLAGRHAGIVACTQDPDVQALACRVHEAIILAGDLPGKLIRIVR